MANSSSPDLAKAHTYVQWSPQEPVIEPEQAPAREPTPKPRGHGIPSPPALLQGKGQHRTGPLHLLDLPVDILRLVAAEIKQTNDLTSLALTCSTLYNLAVPHIYAKFDIVWPDASVVLADSKSVDALTYGLSTLCLGSKFAQGTRWLHGAAVGTDSRRIINNQYTKYTRKFSLGNGPPEWVSEYNIAKDSGKMLGTLVALAVTKMVNLETFVWDMPTGVLSDVFMALASLQDHPLEGQAKLERVHVRWHDNWETHGSATTMSSPAIAPAIHNLPPFAQPMIPFPPAPSTPAPRPKYSDSHVEYPTFSILPPLKSLSVVDIDELAYLDEMSILVERSKDTLQELRIGISKKATTQDFVDTWEGANLQQVDLHARWPGESTIGDKRRGGVLGVIVGRIYEIRQKGRSKSKRHSTGSSTPVADDGGPPSQSWGLVPIPVGPEITADCAPSSYEREASATSSSNPGTGPHGKKPFDPHHEKKRADGKLRLQTLELERITLSMQVCCKAFDWTILTNLTVLSCNRDETLWKVLKKRFAPTAPPGSPPGTLPSQYHLALKKIHTDVTNHALVSFIKETLEPNTLEVLFLQDRRSLAPPTVSIDTIFKVVVKRHRSSLKRLLIDSNDELGRESRSAGHRWQHWVLSSDLVCYVTDGRMRNLRELAVALHYRDWHLFLQRLPNMPELRCLYVPHVQEHTFEPKELALQLVDIITLRPEIRLCYVGIKNKCFEILECLPMRGSADPFGVSSHPHQPQPGDGNHLHTHHHHAGAVAPFIGMEDEDHEDGSNINSEAEETEDDDEVGTTTTSPTEVEDDFTEVSDDAESENGDLEELEGSQSAPRLRLREILSYDDKVAVFKARHGRL